MRIAVISHVVAGHVAAYHRAYVEEFRAAGCEVLDLGPPARSSAFAGMFRQFERWPWWRGRKAWRSAMARLAAAERIAGGVADAVFFPYLDVGFLGSAFSPDEVDQWFPRIWGGVVTGPAAVRNPGRFGGVERILAARHARVLVVTDERFVAPCSAAWPGKTVLAMPEIADVAPPGRVPEVTRLRQWAGSRRLVGLLGVVSAKKNIGAFLAVARRAATARPDLAFVIAGEFSPRVCPGPERRALAADLAELPSNFQFHPAPLADGPEFNAWVEACDCLWLAYRDVHYKSNVLTKAAHLRRPVLVSPVGVMAAHTRQYQLGEVVDPADPADVLAAIDRLDAPSSSERRWAEFATINSRATLAVTVRGILEALVAARDRR